MPLWGTSHGTGGDTPSKICCPTPSACWPGAAWAVSSLKKPLVFPALTAYCRHYRENFFSMMTEYLRRLQECGQLRALEDPELTAVLILEQLSWWAMDVRWTAFGARDIPPERAKAVCLDNHLLAAYARVWPASSSAMLRLN